MEGDVRTGYIYVMARGNDEVEVTSEAPPEEFLHTIQSFAGLLGYEWHQIAVVVYGKEATETMWHSVYGGSSSPTLIPLSPTAEQRHLGDEEYLQIGKQVLGAYERMCRHVKQLSSARPDEKDQQAQQKLAELQGKINLVERVVGNTEWQPIFELRYRAQDKQQICASKIHVSTRTWSRKVHEMTVWIGQALHQALEPSKLRDLIESSARF